MAWRGLKDAADDTDRQLEEYGWMFTVEETEWLRIASSEIRRLITKFEPLDILEEGHRACLKNLDRGASIGRLACCDGEGTVRREGWRLAALAVITKGP